MPPLEEASSRARPLKILAGEGMLVSKVDATYSDRYGRHVLKAGISRVAPDQEVARRHPEWFAVCYRKDLATAKQHRANLRARMEALRGQESPHAKPTTRPAWWIG